MEGPKPILENYKNLALGRELYLFSNEVTLEFNHLVGSACLIYCLKKELISPSFTISGVTSMVLVD